MEKHISSLGINKIRKTVLPQRNKFAIIIVSKLIETISSLSLIKLGTSNPKFGLIMTSGWNDCSLKIFHTSTLDIHQYAT